VTALLRSCSVAAVATWAVVPIEIDLMG